MTFKISPNKNILFKPFKRNVNPCKATEYLCLIMFKFLYETFLVLNKVNSGVATLNRHNFKLNLGWLGAFFIIKTYTLLR